MPKGRRSDPDRAPNARAEKDADEDTAGRAAVVGRGDRFLHDLASHGDRRGVQGRVPTVLSQGERLGRGRVRHTL